MIEIILASKSKVRKNILDKNGIISIVSPSNIDEDLVKQSFLKEKASPEIISKNLAELKANKISQINLNKIVLEDGDVVITISDAAAGAALEASHLSGVGGKTTGTVTLTNARAISGSRSLILADEPTGNLDVKSAQEIIHLFQELCREDGISILMVTHDPLLASMADRMLLLKDGLTAASDIRSAWGIEEVN